MANSAPMAGRATLIAEAISGVNSELRVVTTSVVRCRERSSLWLFSMGGNRFYRAGSRVSMT